MDPLSKINRSEPSDIQNETSSDENAPAKASPGGVSDLADSIEPANVDVFRDAYLAGKSQGKVLMSEANFNHVLQNNLTPKQYPEAFRDLKGWVKSNFSLTPDQHETLNRLKDEQIRKVQDAGARAADLNLPLRFEIIDPDPSIPGPRNLQFGDPVVASDSVNVRQKCERFQQLDPVNVNKSEP
jgi:hypothetical protein